MNELVHVAYVSEATVDFSDEAVRALLERARTKNAALDVTGILLLVGRSFFQIVEGPRSGISTLYETIGRDKRHTRMVKLIEEPIEKRDFGDWSMGLARVTRAELSTLPGFNDFFQKGGALNDLGEGRARQLLGAFREGRWRAA